MYVYTHGTRSYARTMVRFLDPHGIYFGSRILSKEDSTMNGQKGLDVVPVNKTCVVILDDTENVWATSDRSNLMVIKRYYFFDTRNGTRSLCQEGMDESVCAGPLSRALGLLQQVHKSYFQRYNIFGEELLGILLDRNGIHRQKLQGIKDGKPLCDGGSRKRKRGNDGCPSATASKRAK
ncbi:hypothetical protein AgCh_035593 [Apium graveolens]